MQTFSFLLLVHGGDQTEPMRLNAKRIVGDSVAVTNDVVLAEVVVFEKVAYQVRRCGDLWRMR